MNTSSIPPFPWESETPPAAGQYLAPGVYDRILRPYIFDGCSDLDILRDFLKGVGEVRSVLELGCGSGRATQVIVDALPDAQVALVDLSTDMVEHTADRFRHTRSVRAIVSDSVDFMATSEPVDVLVCLWNLSHSVHQHMFRSGRTAAEARIRSVLADFFRSRMCDSALVIHYDIQSDEQRLINPWRLDLWREADPEYDASGQAPSKLLLDDVLEALAREGVVSHRIDRLVGDPIRYLSVEDALETFMVFHMEGHFSLSHPRRDEMVEWLMGQLRRYQDSDGTVSIRPGCFVYTIHSANEGEAM